MADWHTLPPRHPAPVTPIAERRRLAIRQGFMPVPDGGSFRYYKPMRQHIKREEGERRLTQRVAKVAAMRKQYLANPIHAHEWHIDIARSIKWAIDAQGAMLGDATPIDWTKPIVNPNPRKK